jgi:hypothetical protein
LALARGVLSPPAMPIHLLPPALAALVLLPIPVLAGPAPAFNAAPPADAASAEALALRALAIVSSGEPDVEGLQRAAARQVDRAAGGAADFAGRARLAALLPRLTAEYRHGEQTNRVVGYQASGEVDYLRLAPSDTFLVRATWELPSLVAAPGETSAGAQAQAHARRRAEAVEEVTRLHFERRRQRVALLLAPPADPVARAQAELEIARLGAELDALTGGRLGGLARGEP